jgi:hypothetical protein
VILGEVPVEEDGSVYFEVPAGAHVFFQLLDKDKKMVQSMRSGIMVQPGERKGCIGCHEDRLSAPVSGKMPIALRNTPHKLNGRNGEFNTFSYINEVQPIFDKHCIKCHDFGKKAGKSLILAGDRNPFFNASYIDIYVKKKVNLIGGGPAEIQAPKSWGSHASRLSEIIESKNHYAKLSQTEKETIFAWMDLNGVYYPEYESAYPNNTAGRSPLTEDELIELSALTGVNIIKLNTHERTLGPQISFERPELSPCLSSIENDKIKYERAITLIKSASIRLKNKPRADMAGFIPCDTHLNMLEKYEQLQERQCTINRKIAEGEKMYDEDGF